MPIPFQLKLDSDATAADWGHLLPTEPDGKDAFFWMVSGTVLLVDDSENDLQLMTHAVEVAGVHAPILCLRDGQEAIDYLSGAGEYGNRQLHPLPCLVLTDLKMPQMDGFEVLEYMAGRPEFDSVPRLVLSSSSQQKDRKRAMALGACACFEKPLQLNELIDLMKHLDAEWISKHCPKSSGGHH